MNWLNGCALTLQLDGCVFERLKNLCIIEQGIQVRGTGLRGFIRVIIFLNDG